MKQLLKTEIKIKSWLDRMGIENYTLNPDEKYGFTVDVEGDVDLSLKDLKSLKVKFGEIKGDFMCSFSVLKSLQGSPETVSGGFYCDNNELTSLESCPQIVNGDFSCAENKLSNLEYCPQRVDGDFYCESNQLSSLEFCPKSVSGGFYCEDNPMLGDAQNTHNFAEIKEIHQTFVNIKKEQIILSQTLGSVEPQASKNFKI